MHRAASPLLMALALCATATPALADRVSEQAASRLLRDRMQNERPEDLKLLRQAQSQNIVVVRGSMDHIEQVLETAHIRHTVINPDQVAGYDLNADMIVMVNCPGHMPNAGVRRLARFVRAGGTLYTTDWALKNVVEKAFPSTIVHNGASTGDHVTPVHVHGNNDNLMSNMLLTKGSQPQWWLEGGSYPVKIVGKNVDVLASSRQMQQRYHSSPVVVRFRWEDGEVIHVVSHFYRQVAAKGPAVAAKQATGDMQGLTVEQKKDFADSPAAAAPMADVESSYAFQAMTSNLVVEKSKKNVALDRAYNFTTKEELNVEGRLVKPGERLRVLKRHGRKAVVRDDRGNEAEVDAEALEAR